VSIDGGGKKKKGGNERQVPRIRDQGWGGKACTADYMGNNKVA